MTDPEGFEVTLTIQPDRFVFATREAVDAVTQQIVDKVNELAYVTTVSVQERVGYPDLTDDNKITGDDIVAFDHKIQREGR